MMKKEYDEKSPKLFRTSSSTQAVGTTKNDENDNDSDVKSIEDCIKFLGKKKAYEILAAAVEDEKEFEHRVKENYVRLAEIRQSSPCKFYKGRRDYQRKKRVGKGDDLSDAVWAMLDLDHHVHDCHTCGNFINLT